MKFLNKTSQDYSIYARARSFARARGLSRVLCALLVLNLTASLAAQAQTKQTKLTDPAKQYVAALTPADRLTAITAAIQSRRSSHIAWFTRAFAAESSPAVRAKMIDGAAALDPRGVASIALFEQGLRDSDPVVRLVSIRALGRAGGSQAVSDLSQVLVAEKSGGVLDGAAFWLGQSAGGTGMSALGQCLTAGHARARAACARALAGLGTAQAKAALLPALRDPDAGVRQAAEGR